ncbi:glycoside hydrolase family 5 protein [Rhodotorula graminis WP1]|uniref:mannan endo-1,4-beta-mannosidase n=1 Tax=Rhodotorula graminis (strain WP1) TaxID=578459 RepID=A0A194S6H5_RHOGW|nr:glycoside hydrolase family 5 protein [Rhodotorula graminis WP1]KPV76197.1 glycoside hydrolase family 5 protein [Rhodotorula graminis WP1]
MRRPRLRTSPASLALAAAIAATTLASLVTASSSSPASPHAPHPAAHRAIPHPAGHGRFAARAAAGANSADPASPDLLLVERGLAAAADDDAQARSALFEGEVAGNAIEGEVKVSGWTADDDLWMASGTYDLEGAAGALHIKISDNSTAAAPASASASSAGEDEGEGEPAASASAAAGGASSATDDSSSQAGSSASESSVAESTTSCTDAPAATSGSASPSGNQSAADSVAATSSGGASTSTTSRKMYHGQSGSSTKIKATGTKTLDPDSLETKLLINPKWIALNPKWTPTALLATVVTPAPTKTSIKTSSASATKTSTVALTLPAPPASTCQPQYTNTAGGAVYGPGLGSFNFLPRPSTFVKRSGNKLTLDGDTYRIVGPNIYWLGLDENVNWQVSYPSKQRVREAMAITVAMGGNTIRSHTLGVSTGHSKTLWPNAWSTNKAAFDPIDYAIFAARNYGLRLIIPLTDNYAYYHGGKYDFIGWAGADTNDASQFYYNDDVISLFKGYISVLLNHVNAYTGVALKDDPTIMAWETGNELGGYMLGGGAPPASWTKDIASYIKKLAPNHLVADGTDGLTDYGGSLATTGMKVSNVDLVTDHFYPALQWLLVKDKNWMNSYQSKVFFVGENDWTGLKGGDDLDTFYSTIENMDGSGSMMWSIFGHDDRCCDWIYHNDGYSLYYPNGMSSSMNKAAIKLMKHWYRMRGLTPPSALPAVACPQPELTE